jgi:hypothetical protein
MPKLSNKCLKATNAEKKQNCVRAKNTQTCKNAYGQQMPKFSQKMLKSNKCSLKGKNALGQKCPN